MVVHESRGVVVVPQWRVVDVGVGAGSARRGASLRRQCARAALVTQHSVVNKGVVL